MVFPPSVFYVLMDSNIIHFASDESVGVGSAVFADY